MKLSKTGRDIRMSSRVFYGSENSFMLMWVQGTNCSLSSLEKDERYLFLLRLRARRHRICADVFKMGKNTEPGP